MQKMAKSSINFQPVKSTSESHNLREQNLDYNRDDLVPQNDYWVDESISARQTEIEKLCKKLSKRKLQKNATPIREAVINLNENHTINDLKKLGETLSQEKGIHLFQIHIHRDEGRWVDENDKTIPTKTPHIPPHKKAIWKTNHHAHLIFDWQDKDKGSMKRLGKVDMSQIQTIVARELKMERGKESNVKRLDAIEFKVEQRKRELGEVKQELNVKQKELESTSNEVEQEEKSTRAN